MIQWNAIVNSQYSFDLFGSSKIPRIVNMLTTKNLSVRGLKSANALKKGIYKNESIKTEICESNYLSRSACRCLILKCHRFLNFFFLNSPLEFQQKTTKKIIHHLAGWEI